jgi:hypothetical protein
MISTTRKGHKMNTIADNDTVYAIFRTDGAPITTLNGIAARVRAARPLGFASREGAQRAAKLFWHVDSVIVPVSLSDWRAL